MAECLGREWSDVCRKQAMTALFLWTDTTFGAMALRSTAGWSIWTEQKVDAAIEKRKVRLV